MLNTIKSLIKEKKSFNEAADLLLEDTELDDSLILISEGPDELEIPEDEKKDDEPKEGEETAGEPKEGEEKTPEEGPTDAPEGEQTPSENPEGEALPEPIGAQTGEPAQLGDSDLLSMDIDLQSNTPKDILPTPPTGAADVVPEGDTQKVDAGFGTADVVEPEDSRDPVPEDEAVDLLDLPIDEEVEIPDPNGVAKKEEKGEEKKREDATPTEKTDEFKEAKDLLDEEIDEEEEPEKKECGETQPAEECGDPAPATPTEESKEEPKEESKDPNTKTEEAATKVAPKTENKEEKPKVIFDKIGDVNGMTPEQIKNAMLPGLKAKLESAGILDQFVEAISIGDDGGDAAATEADPAHTDGTEAPAEEPATDAQTDNVVTAAVKDKLGEMNASDGESNAASSKEAILKKLSNLSKALEDTKNLVIDSSK